MYRRKNGKSKRAKRAQVRAFAIYYLLKRLELLEFVIKIQKEKKEDKDNDRYSQEQRPLVDNDCYSQRQRPSPTPATDYSLIFQVSIPLGLLCGCGIVLSDKLSKFNSTSTVNKRRQLLGGGCRLQCVVQLKDPMA
jgi:hypothetical protein